MKKYMEIAIKEAIIAKNNGDIPVGAVIVKNDKIISKAHNEKEKNNCVIDHAEIIAIRKACKKLKTWHLDDCEIYITMEPCMMCMGAIIQSRIKKVIYGVKNEKFGGISDKDSILLNKKLNYNNFVMYDAYENEIKKILKDFFIDKRK